MPRFDRTGPMGQGPMTGRGLGPCGGGRGWGRFGGRGFGWGNYGRYYSNSPLNEKEEVEILSEDAKILEEELKAIKSRLADIKDQK
ncbi:MAG: DUF5320 domain-containing protein [Candidatus Zambryskibacteria bacterium]|nr:DUF5320 domain-containing protein [Candidatus Zambryskibacteria bacterium]